MNTPIIPLTKTELQDLLDVLNRLQATCVLYDQQWYAIQRTRLITCNRLGWINLSHDFTTSEWVPQE